MKKQITTFLILVLSCSSCKNKEHTKVDEFKKQLIESIDPNMKMEFLQDNFQYVYQYSQGESNQMLGIKIIDKKTIQFHLLTKTLPCDTEYWGIAKNKYDQYDSEVDEDENGTAYGAKEYIYAPKYKIAIRLALDSSKVVLKYTINNDKYTDCLPITDKIMKRIK